MGAEPEAMPVGHTGGA